MLVLFSVYVKHVIIFRDIELFCFVFVFELCRGFTYYEPCIIPEYLRGQLDEFEAVYDISNSNNGQRLDANLNQTCESLYEYVCISVVSSLKVLLFQLKCM